jgi:hypothetical protein
MSRHRRSNLTRVGDYDVFARVNGGDGSSQAPDSSADTH